jgi:four helix bundle protein
MMHQYKKLIIWQKAVKLSVQVFEMTKDFPKEERFGLTQQIRKSAVSIPSNIAEGSGRISSKEMKQFLRVAYGSSCELETQLIIAKEVRYLETSSLLRITEDISALQKMMYSFYISEVLN